MPIRTCPTDTARRRLLGLLAASPLALAAGGAQAFQLAPLDEEAARDYRAACTPAHPGYHQALADELVERLAAEGIEADADELAAALEAMSCPLCGCAVAQAPDVTLPDAVTLPEGAKRGS